MRYLILNEGIDYKNPAIKELLEALSCGCTEECKDIFEISIDSWGGAVPIGLYLLDVLNRNKHRVTLTVTGEVSSCAFMIWAGFEGYKSVTAGSWAVVHMSTRQGTIRDHKFDDGTKQLLKDGKYMLKVHERYTLPELTEKEAELWLNERDITIPYTRLKTIAAKHNKLNKAKKPK